MKILDIITPHETLNEAGNPLARNLERWIIEPLFGKAASGSVEQRVSAWVEKQLVDTAGSGHVINRTKSLNQAEKQLVSVWERNPYPDDVEKIESIANALAKYLTEQSSSISGDNVMAKLKDILVHDRQGKYVPSVYQNAGEFLADPFVQREIIGLVTANGERIEMKSSKYIKELAEARAGVIKEVKSIQPEKTKAQKKKEADDAETLKKQQDTAKIKTDNDLQAAKNTSTKLALEAKALEEELAANKLEIKAFFKSQDKLFKYFAGAEVIRTYVQFQQQVNNIQKWQYGYKDGTPIPEEIAKFFPVVPTAGLQESEPSIQAEVTRPGDGKKYFYRTDKQRYDCASSYAFFTVSLLWVKQLAAGSISWFAPELTAKYVPYIGGKIPIIGKAKIVHNIIELFNNALASSPRITKTLGSISWLSKVFVVDYMMTNVVANQDASENLAYWLNTALEKSTGAVAGVAMDATNAINRSDFTQEEIADARQGLSMLPDYDQAPELAKAWASVVLQGPIESMKKGSYARTFMEDAVATYLIPYAVAQAVIIKLVTLVVDATRFIWPIIGKMIGGTEGKPPVDRETHQAPTPVTPVVKPAVTVNDPAAVQDQGNLAGDNRTSTNVEPPKVNTTNSNPEIDPFIIKESLKREVENLMSN